MRLFAEIDFGDVTNVSLNPCLLHGNIYYIDIVSDKVYNMIPPTIDSDSDWEIWQGVLEKNIYYDPLNDEYYDDYPDDIKVETGIMYSVYEDGKLVDERYEIYD